MVRYLSIVTSNIPRPADFHQTKNTLQVGFLPLRGGWTFIPSLPFPSRGHFSNLPCLHEPAGIIMLSSSMLWIVETFSATHPQVFLYTHCHLSVNAESLSLPVIVDYYYLSFWSRPAIHVYKSVEKYSPSIMSPPMEGRYEDCQQLISRLGLFTYSILLTIVDLKTARNHDKSKENRRIIERL